MRILTAPLTAHDASICILEDGKIIEYWMEERYSRLKNDQRLERSFKNFKNISKYLKLDVILIAENFFDEYTYGVENALRVASKIKSKFNLDETKVIVDKEKHHVYHAYSGFYNSGFDEAICFSLDGSGALTDTGLEIEAIYHIKKGEPEKLLHSKKRDWIGKFSYGELMNFVLIDGEWVEADIDNAISAPEGSEEELIQQLSVGELFSWTSVKFGMDLLNGAGKVMGLAQYKHHKDKLEGKYNNDLWKSRVDESYDLQQKTQKHVLSLIKKYTEQTGVKKVVISGGYGLNCVANYFYLKNLKDIDLYIDPICFDAGISIGAAYYNCSHEDRLKIQPLKNAYLGHQEVFYSLYRDDIEVKKVSYDDVADLIIQGHPVALFQGKSEAGQRALGNRSLLFDPRIPNGKDLVNFVKKRETYRPFAGTILLEEAHKWFNMLSLKESPYMQYAMDAYPNAVEKVPAIIHADNTCRIQTVTEEQNEHFYKLIQSFYKKTEIPMLLNTSFNLAGDPLVETFDDAMSTLSNSRIEYLYLPEPQILIKCLNGNYIKTETPTPMKYR